MAYWASSLSDDFKRRFISFLAFEFRNIPIKLALSLLDPQLTSTTSEDDLEDDGVDTDSFIITKVIYLLLLLIQ